MRKAWCGKTKKELLQTVAISNCIPICVISGRFETTLLTLKTHPSTLLGDDRKRLKAYFNHTKQEYFFNRNRPSFDAILYYYQSFQWHPEMGGRLIRPSNVPVDVFAEEIIFFQLGEHVYERFREEEGFIKEETPPMPQSHVQKTLWRLFEYPETSMAATIIAIVSVIFILTSIAAFIIETWPPFPEKYKDNTVLADNPFFIVESTCIAWFTVEFIVRFICSPFKLPFLFSFLNIVDIVAIVPYYITVFLWAVADGSSNQASNLAILRVFRLIRVFRVLKLSRHASGLQVLGKTISSSVKELAMLTFISYSISVILYGAAIYFAEHEENEEMFASIPHSFWWALITMTTVGYGDAYPITGWGKLVGALCAITGVLSIALPVPVIVSNFSYYYHREKDQTVYADYLFTDDKTVTEDSDNIGFINDHL
ncbi:PREDICTED: LOW QUALITY PROTEIN: potassium voltage-gated channel subfamily A member 1-like [Priapulus caudatus]|uniref:LOW QUALITY PROTEIN: potassium voltage-gated channel subfamily A member 1-like n=1 Tax=Priapulus caudatus TaxID=37621 RepID=A0ABM1E771_PRICU|nr:PREDICTED: LOW QUALITY PROTEIN: potassium voltage-gated channel subfamily A member 1-like [Priapulus caudatus]